jgi:formylglycine-generating enzyme required for sulfatase activity
MDTTEVTMAQYADFLQALEPVKNDTACDWNTTYAALDYVWTAMTDPDQAVAGIDWCDARDYCTWAGKRLCGALDGGSLGYDAYASPASQWYVACSQGLDLRHPYGTVLDDTAKPGYCHLDAPLATVGAQAVVGSYPKCEVADTGVYDLLGNVEEWIDACETGLSSETTRCRVLGGVWYFDSSYSTCAFADTAGGAGIARSAASKAIGFRCCAE